MPHKWRQMNAGTFQLILVIAFIVMAFTVSALLQTTRSDSRSTSNTERTLFVETQTVSPAPYRIAFAATGNVVARTRIDIVPEVSGRVVTVHEDFYNGGRFEKNTALFAIDPRDFRLEIQRLRAEVARAQTALELEQAETEAALEEWGSLHPGSEVPDLVARKPQLAEARANLRAAHAQLADAKLGLERSVFRLPFAGRVIESTIAPGQYVQAGQTYGSVFDTDSLEVEASLEDTQLQWLLQSAAPTITITADYLGKTHRFTGLLKRGAASLDNATRFAQVQFGFVEDAAALIPGVFAQLHITGEPVPDITSIPSSAYQSDGRIWHVTAENTLKPIQPDILFADGTHLAVRNISGPITVVTSRVSGATEGMAVTLAGGNQDQ
jgi:RND family efflux transporter MFP subunit